VGLRIDLYRSGIDQKLSQITFLKVDGREKFLSDELLRPSHVCPAVLTKAGALNSEEFSIVHNTVWLSTGELEKSLSCRILHLIGITLVSNILPVWLRRLQEDIETLKVVELECNFVNKFSSLLSIHLLLFCEVVERRAYELQLLVLSNHVVILVELGVHYISLVLLFVGTSLGDLRECMSREEKSESVLTLLEVLLEQSCFH